MFQLQTVRSLFDATSSKTGAAHGGELLELAPGGSGLSEALLDEPGGFLWWYLDLIDDDGSGLVVIWSFGLPFLPGYADAARRGEAPPPSERPSLNVCVYDRGELDFYLLQEFDASQVDWQAGDDGDRWNFGDSRIVSELEGDQRVVELDLALEVPGLDEVTRIRVDGRGQASHFGDGQHEPGRRTDEPLPVHDWVPLVCVCCGEATVRVGKQVRQIQGRLYHDRNGGRRPLHQLGIDAWIWGRIALPGRELIYYLLDGVDEQDQCLVLSIDDAGRIDRIEDCQLERTATSVNLGGLRWWPSLTLNLGADEQLRVDLGDVVDSGPFYLRSVLEAVDQSGARYRGIGEICRPDRVDLTRHRPLVRMRVHRQEGANSMWLPLFTGPRRGRVRRLLASWVPGNGGES